MSQRPSLRTMFAARWLFLGLATVAISDRLNRPGGQLRYVCCRQAPYNHGSERKV